MRFTIRSFFWASAAFVFSLFAAGCSTAETSCTYQGATLTIGDSVLSDDGCSECTCESDGTVHCAKTQCVTCTRGDQTYAYHATIPLDQCNVCTCEHEGAFVCTQVLCQP